MDKLTNLALSSYNTLRADAAEKLRVADRLGAHVAASLILKALPTASALLLSESDQSVDFAWELAHLLDADGEAIADIDITGIALTDGTLIPFEDGDTVWTIINELPERIPTVNDMPAPEYTTWFQPSGHIARINLRAAASEDA